MQIQDKSSINKGSSKGSNNIWKLSHGKMLQLIYGKLYNLEKISADIKTLSGLPEWLEFLKYIRLHVYPKSKSESV